MTEMYIVLGICLLVEIVLFIFIFRDLAKKEGEE